jgi:hypothetical protein
MTIIQAYKNKISVADLRSNVAHYLSAKLHDNQDVYEALVRMGNPYGASVFPDRYHTRSISGLVKRAHKPTSPPPESIADKVPDEPGFLRRYSVVYLLREQYRQLNCSTREQAREALNLLLEDEDRTPVGIYDDKTELFEWEHSLREEYEKASMKEQGQRGAEIINIAQALRRRDWDLGEFRRPSLFA